jgi:hypothetical protein
MALPNIAGLFRNVGNIPYLVMQPFSHMLDMKEKVASVAEGALVVRGRNFSQEEIMSMLTLQGRKLGLLPREEKAESMDFPVEFDVMKMMMTERVSTSLPPDLDSVKSEIFRVFWSRFHEEFHRDNEPTKEGVLLRSRALYFMVNLRAAEAEKKEGSEEHFSLCFIKESLDGSKTEEKISSEEDLRKYLLRSTGSEEIYPIVGVPLRYKFSWFRELFQTTIKVHGTSDRVQLQYRQANLMSPSEFTVIDSSETLAACLKRYRDLDPALKARSGFSSSFFGGHIIPAKVRVIS